MRPSADSYLVLNPLFFRVKLRKMLDSDERNHFVDKPLAISIYTFHFSLFTLKILHSSFFISYLILLLQGVE